MPAGLSNGQHHAGIRAAEVAGRTTGPIAKAATVGLHAKETIDTVLDGVFRFWGIPVEFWKRILKIIQQQPREQAGTGLLDATVRVIAQKYYHATNFLFLGRGIMYPFAREGALKLKEISYIHAEGYAAGEMKHGPIALIDEHVPVICIAPGNDPLFDKTMGNVQEVIARGGKVIFLSDANGVAKLEAQAKPMASLLLPEVDPFVAPLLYTIPVQLLAYHVAVLKGTAVAQPRNLAKSETVE